MPTDERPFFARRLEELRTKAQMSPSDLARRSGLSKQALSHLELGRREPTWDTVQRLALALGVSANEFADPSVRLPDSASSPPRGRPRTKKEGSADD